MKSFIKIQCAWLSGMLLLAVSVTTNAGQVTIPNTFSSGTPALASEVNANFSAVATEVNDNDTRVTANTDNISNLQSQIPSLAVYDFNDYFGTAVASHTYDFQRDGFACDRETHSYVRNNVSGGVQLLRTIERTDSTGTNPRCHYRVEEYMQTTQAVKLVARSNRNPENPATENSIGNARWPVTQLTNAMRIGAPWGDASGTFFTPTDGTTSRGHMVEIHTLLAVEDVPVTQVPAGPFTGCLKIHTSRRGQHDPFRGLTVMSWYCPNVGLVRRITKVSNGPSQRIKLLSWQ